MKHRENAPDWEALQKEYIAGGISYRQLGEKYGLSASVIGRRAKEEGWQLLRCQESERDIQAQVRQDMRRVSRQLLGKISRSIDELDIVVLKEVEKVRDVEYENPERPDKPTRESTRETERLVPVHSVIDRNGIKLLAAALKDIKDAQLLRTAADLREQEAKIANLQRQAEGEKTDSAIQICFSPEADRLSK